MQSYVSTLANFRKKSTAITQGKLMQYVPDDGLYVYFRYDSKQTVMCVMNTSEKIKRSILKNIAERTAGFSSAKNILNEKSVASTFTVPGKRMWVLELQK